MGKHSTESGGKSTYGQKDGQQRYGNYDGNHRKPETTPPAGSDVPARGEGITYDNTKG